MAMFQYFKKVDGQYPGSKLPDPQGALAQKYPLVPYLWQIPKLLYFSKLVE